MRIKFQEFILENYSRFLDDSQTPLEALDSVIEDIQFTMEFGDKKIPFLDILIRLDSSEIWMDLHHKPTATQRCLPYSTSHPKHCLKKYSICNG